MKLLVLSAAAIHELLDFAACAQAMRDVLLARSRGEVFQPLRSVYEPPGAAGRIGLMPSYLGGTSAGGGGDGDSGSGAAPGLVAAGFGLKALCLMPGNPALGLDSHQGIVLLSSPDTGAPLAVLNASAVTEIRTAAVSAVATELLARPEADVLAIIGTGVQARAHLRAIAATRELAQVRVAGRTPAAAAAFAAEMTAKMATPPEVIGCESAAEAIGGAGIVVTVTSSPAPVLRRDWLSAGTHVNAVGACLPQAREIDSATMAAAALFADSRESVLAEAGDYLIPAAEGLIGPDGIRAEIGDLLTPASAAAGPGVSGPSASGAGTAAFGRQNPDEITLFESLGLAIEDLAAGFVAYQAARDRGEGAWIDF